MLEKILDLIKRHDSFILTTHDTVDADGLGAELVFIRILKELGKEAKILNASPIPVNFRFMDPHGLVEQWDREKYPGLPEKSALIILDTADDYLIGTLKEIIGLVKEIFVIDHHQINPLAALSGVIDSSAASTCEIAVESAQAAGITLDLDTASAAFAGISYDTGSFSYAKTTARTFRAALKLVEAGVVPHTIHRELHESAPMGALLLQRKVLSSLEIRAQGRVAVQILRKEDLESTGSRFEDAENFINVPLKAGEITVSIMVKENIEGKVRCSLRSKGAINVSKIAQQFGGGGHLTAAGFRSERGIEETLDQVLKKIEPLLGEI